MTTASPLPVVRAADLQAPDEERRWLIDSLWARAGVGIVGGAPKCCKSWLGLDMALSVASATPCLGAFPVLESGSVLLYMAEDSTAIVKERLTGLCCHRGLDLATLPIDVITAPTVRLDLERDQQRLAETVRQQQPRLLLLDPFVRLHRIDENHAGDVSAILAYLRALQRQYDLALVVVHHARKNGPAGVQAGQGLRGSGDFHAWGDSNLYLRRQQNHLLLTIEHRAAQAPDPLSLSLVHSERGDDTHLELAGTPTDDPKSRSPTAHTLGTDLMRVLAQATQPLTRADLRAALHVRNERLGEALQRLTTDGAICRHGQGWLPSPAAVPVPAL